MRLTWLGWLKCSHPHMSELHQLCPLYSQKTSDSRTSGVRGGRTPRHQNFLPSKSLSRTISQITTSPWALEPWQPLWFIYCYSQEFRLSGQLHALHGNSSLSRRAPGLLVYAANSCCCSGSWFCMPKSQDLSSLQALQRHLRLLGTVCLMLLQPLIK